MSTYVVHATGLPRADVGAVMAELREEFSDAPAPGRGEVDEFLERQAAQVQQEPNLTEKRRESIVQRLRAGIGRMLPDGATFAAWRNIMSRAWERARKPLTVAVVGAASVGFIAGATVFMQAQGEYQDAWHSHKNENVAMAVHDKYGDTITGTPSGYGKWLHEYTVNGQREVCDRDYDMTDDLIVTDVTIACKNADGEFVSLPVSGKVDASRQSPYTHYAGEYFGDNPTD